MDPNNWDPRTVKSGFPIWGSNSSSISVSPVFTALKLDPLDPLWIPRKLEFYVADAGIYAGKTLLMMLEIQKRLTSDS